MLLEQLEDLGVASHNLRVVPLESDPLRVAGPVLVQVGPGLIEVNMESAQLANVVLIGVLSQHQSKLVLFLTQIRK